MAWPNKFRWSLDGTKVLLSWGNTIVIDLEKEQTRVISTTWSSAEWGNGSNLVFFFEASRKPGEVALKGFYAANLESGARDLLLGPDALVESRIEPTALFHVPFIYASVDGKHLVINSRSESNGTTLRFYDLTTQARPDLRKPDRTTNSGDILPQLAWSPTGDAIAAIAVSDTQVFRLMRFDLSMDEWIVVSTLALRDDTPLEVFAYKALSWAE